MGVRGLPTCFCNSPIITIITRVFGVGALERLAVEGSALGGFGVSGFNRAEFSAQGLGMGFGQVRAVGCWRTLKFRV